MRNMNTARRLEKARAGLDAVLAAGGRWIDCDTEREISNAYLFADGSVGRFTDQGTGHCTLVNAAGEPALHFVACDEEQHEPNSCGW